MALFAMSAMRVEHTVLVKQLQGAFVATHGSAENVQKFAEALEVKDPSVEKKEEEYARDRARLKADLASRRAR